MANAINTLAGLVTLNDQNIADIFPSNVLDTAPLVASLVAVPASNGTNHKYKRKTTAGSAGFRAVETGLANTQMQVELVTDVLKYLDATVYSDIALADGYAGGASGYLALEMEEQFRAAFFALEKQIIRGTNSDAAGFVGLDGILSYLGHTMVVDAGGSGSDLTKVYAIRSTREDVAVVAGNEGRITFNETPSLVKGIDGSSNPFVQYMMPVGGWFGLQIASTYSVGAIVNIESSGSSNVLTDDMIADLLSRFPAGKGATMLVMNRTALKELQNSRTATNPTGAPAPFPESAFNVPIITTDAILNTNSAVATTT